MRHKIVGLVLALALPGGGARADFLLLGQPPVTPPPAAFSADANPSRPAPPVRSKPTAPLFKTAQGFGNQVPLAFAVKQIVPKPVKVTFGRGADPDALVSWHGGHPWNRTLMAAVRPLGLKLVVSRAAVEIRK